MHDKVDNRLRIEKETIQCLSLADDAANNPKSQIALDKKFTGIKAIPTEKQLLAKLKFDKQGVAERTVKPTDNLNKIDPLLARKISVLKTEFPNYATVEILPEFFEKTINKPYNVKSQLVMLV